MHLPHVVMTADELDEYIVLHQSSDILQAYFATGSAWDISTDGPEGSYNPKYDASHNSDGWGDRPLFLKSYGTNESRIC